MRSRLFILLLAASSAIAQTNDAAYPLLERAYQALRDRSYDKAVQAFQLAIEASPARADIRKDLAYTYLKIGDNDAARDQFAHVVRLNPSDDHVAMEYAFLCYEAKQEAVARRVFDRIRKTGNPTAEQAFRNIDTPLVEGIARWKKALEHSGENFSAHVELAKLAEQRDELELSAEHYGKAFRLRPDLRELLLHLGRIWKLMKRPDDASAALIAASRGAEPRVAEAARELLPSRYPYVYEFEKALELDPRNTELRRELAYLHLAMGNKTAAETRFEEVLRQDPSDGLSAAQLGFLRLRRNDLRTAMPLLDQALKSGNEELAEKIRAALNLPPALRPRSAVTPAAATVDAKTLAEKSFQAGYLKDALKYLKVAHEEDPIDFSVMLKLGWTQNMLRDDREAIQWFQLARKSPDEKISAEADRAYRTLRPGLARYRTTVWVSPFYSTRWSSLFSYAQAKTDLKLGSLPIRPYLSVRFMGDSRGAGRDANRAIHLSESSFIVGMGLATNSWKGIVGWAEAGSAIRYIQRDDVGRMVPDYRGGVSWSRGFGHNLGPESNGPFVETNADGVFVSRFGNDVIGYSQWKGGYTVAPVGPVQLQFYWNGNVTVDLKRQHWANFVEQGPGVRLKIATLPNALVFSANVLRGTYLIKEGNPQGAGFSDFRAGLWYAFTY